MKSNFKLMLNTFCLSIIVLSQTTTHAAPTGEIIFRSPEDYRELWIGNANDGQTAQPLFKLPHDITHFSIQRNGRYIVAVVKINAKDEFDSVYDVYFYDRKKQDTVPRKLTQGEYSEIIDVDVSSDGDVVFTNHSFVIIDKILKRGLYVISNQEIEKEKPNAKLLQQVDAYKVDWAPNGKQIAFSTDRGIFIFNTTTKMGVHVIKDGEFPVFSPNSKQLAFLTKTKPYKLGIVSVVGPRNLQYIEPEEDAYIEFLTWSADGKYLVYSSYIDRIPIFSYFNFAVHIESGVIERVLETYSNGGLSEFEWARRAYSLEPEGLLTTVWGEIKQKK